MRTPGAQRMHSHTHTHTHAPRRMYALPVKQGRCNSILVAKYHQHCPFCGAQFPSKCQPRYGRHFFRTANWSKAICRPLLLGHLICIALLPCPYTQIRWWHLTAMWQNLVLAPRSRRTYFLRPYCPVSGTAQPAVLLHLLAVYEPLSLVNFTAAGHSPHEIRRWIAPQCGGRRGALYRSVGCHSSTAIGDFSVLSHPVA
jgi:hypothetical protein